MMPALLSATPGPAGTSRTAGTGTRRPDIQRERVLATRRSAMPGRRPPPNPHPGRTSPAGAVASRPPRDRTPMLVSGAGHPTAGPARPRRPPGQRQARTTARSATLSPRGAPCGVPGPTTRPCGSAARRRGPRMTRARTPLTAAGHSLAGRDRYHATADRPTATSLPGPGVPGLATSMVPRRPGGSRPPNAPPRRPVTSPRSGARPATGTTTPTAGTAPPAHPATRRTGKARRPRTTHRWPVAAHGPTATRHGTAARAPASHGSRRTADGAHRPTGSRRTGTWPADIPAARAATRTPATPRDPAWWTLAALAAVPLPETGRCRCGTSRPRWAGRSRPGRPPARPSGASTRGS